jgi:plasmid stabilization system protein ParE
MRRIIFAPSFSREADDIAAYIDERFGEKASDEFIANLMAVCTLIGNFPSLGKTDHEYATDLAGFPFKHNWIFYEADHRKVRFVHIVRADATGVPFGFERI